MVAASAAVLPDGGLQVRARRPSCSGLCNDACFAFRWIQTAAAPLTRTSRCVLHRALIPTSAPLHPPQVACMPAHSVCTQVVACGQMPLAVLEGARAAAAAAAGALHALLRSRMLAAIKSQS